MNPSQILTPGLEVAFLGRLREFLDDRFDWYTLLDGRDDTGIILWAWHPAQVQLREGIKVQTRDGEACFVTCGGAYLGVVSEPIDSARVFDQLMRQSARNRRRPKRWFRRLRRGSGR
jgi:hypothetical protein